MQPQSMAAMPQLTVAQKGFEKLLASNKPDSLRNSSSQPWPSSMAAKKPVAPPKKNKAAAPVQSRAVREKTSLAKMIARVKDDKLNKIKGDRKRKSSDILQNSKASEDEFENSEEY